MLTHSLLRAGGATSSAVVLDSPVDASVFRSIRRPPTQVPTRPSTQPRVQPGFPTLPVRPTPERAPAPSTKPLTSFLITDILAHERNEVGRAASPPPRARIPAPFPRPEDAAPRNQGGFRRFVDESRFGGTDQRDPASSSSPSPESSSPPPMAPPAPEQLPPILSANPDRGTIFGQIRLLHSMATAASAASAAASAAVAASLTPPRMRQETMASSGWASTTATSAATNDSDDDEEDEIDVENVADEEEEEEEEGEEEERKAAPKRKATKRKNEESGNNSNSSNNGVSPLDALLQMTSKAFDGRQDAKNGAGEGRDHLHLFSKSQPPKKRRKSRTAFTNQQIYELEKRFLYQKYLSPADRDQIASSLGLSNAQVITWFQNRRAKMKRDLEELKADVKAAKMHSVQSLEFLKKFNMVEAAAVAERQVAGGVVDGDSPPPSTSPRRPPFVPKSGAGAPGNAHPSSSLANSSPSHAHSSSAGIPPSLGFYPEAFLLGRVGGLGVPGASGVPPSTSAASSSFGRRKTSSSTSSSPLQIDVESASPPPRQLTPHLTPPRHSPLSYPSPSSSSSSSSPNPDLPLNLRKTPEGARAAPDNSRTDRPRVAPSPPKSVSS